MSQFPQPISIITATMKSIRQERIALNLLLVAAILLLSFPASSANGFKDKLFPTVQVNLTNESGKDVYYMCNFENYDKSFHLLPKGGRVSWSFKQYLFPSRWCYLYVNDQTHGFFFAYTVRLRCRQCEWKIRPDGPYILNPRPDFHLKNLELTYLHPLPGTVFKPDIARDNADALDI